MKNNMNVWRRKVQKRGSGKIESILDYANYFETPQGESLLFYDENTNRKLSYKLVKDKNDVHLILYDEQFLEDLKEATVGHADATYQSRPCMKGVKQLLTILVRVYNKVSIK